MFPPSNHFVYSQDKAVASESVIRKLKKRDCKGETELHRESKRGNLEKVLQLLELGADPNTEDNASLRPLHEHKALEVGNTLIWPVIGRYCEHFLSFGF